MPPTHDEELLGSPPARGLSPADGARLEQITGELAQGFSALSCIGPAVSVFGSAVVRPPDPAYELARLVGRELGRAGLGHCSSGSTALCGGRGCSTPAMFRCSRPLMTRRRWWLQCGAVRPLVTLKTADRP